MTTFRMLTDEEKIRGPVDFDLEVAMALDDDGHVISFFAFDKSPRQDPCSVCTRNCGKTRRLWTVMERRGEGIFKDLHAWALKENGLDRIYEQGVAPLDSAVILQKYRDIIPPARGPVEVIDYAAAEAGAKELLAQLEKAVNG